MRCKGLRLGLVAFAGAMACSPRDHATRNAGATASAPLASPAFTADTVLSFERLPVTALASLKARWPDFRVFEVARFDSATRARFAVAPDQGLVVLRGNFGGDGRESFVVAGRRGAEGALVGLLADGRGGYRAELASELPSGDSVAPTQPPVVIGKVLCEFSCANRAQEAVRIIVLGAEKSRPRVLFWDSRRRLFSSDEP